MIYATWDEVPIFLGEDDPAPPPKRGGTFVYCPFPTCYPDEDKPLVHTRFRTEKAYRRHWRRQHASSVG